MRFDVRSRFRSAMKAAKALRYPGSRRARMGQFGRLAGGLAGGIVAEGARRLAEGLSAMRRAHLDPEDVQTNIVYVDLDPEGASAAETVERIAGEGVRVGATGTHQFRAVTHYGITEDDIEKALKAFARILA